MCNAVYLLSVCLLPGIGHRVHGLRLARLAGWHALVSVRRRSQLHRYSYLDLHLLPVRQGGAQTAHQLDTDGNTLFNPVAVPLHRPPAHSLQISPDSTPQFYLFSAYRQRLARRQIGRGARLTARHHPVLKLMSGAKPPLPHTQGQLYL